MALLICPDCGGKVSEHAEFCPHCGCPILNIKDAANAKMTSVTLEDRANAGDAEAQCSLALSLYYGGDGYEVDRNSALKWLLVAIDSKNYGAKITLKLLFGIDINGITSADDYFSLGIDYSRGERVPKNIVFAMWAYHKAAKQGHAGAQNNLAVLYDNGTEVPRDVEKAIYWYRESIKNGGNAARFNLGLSYYWGDGIEKNEEQAYDLISTAANNGHEKAREFLRKHFPQNELEKFMFKGMKEYLTAGVGANLGSSERMFALACNFHFGNTTVSIPKDEGKARSWLLQSSAYGFSLSDKYLRSWYSLSIDKSGTADDWVEKGSDYEHGRSVAKDIAVAAYYYACAARAKHPTGLNNLACCLMNGSGVEKNAEKAFALLQEASGLGNDRASLNLAVCLFNGWGTQKNLLEAKHYAERATNNGFQDAIRFLEEYFPKHSNNLRTTKTITNSTPNQVNYTPTVNFIPYYSDIIPQFLNGYSVLDSKFESDDIGFELDCQNQARLKFERQNLCDYYDAVSREPFEESDNWIEFWEGERDSLGYFDTSGEVDTFRNLNDGDEYVYYLPGTISESAVLEGIDITQKLLETVRKSNLRRTIDEVLSTLTPREEKVLRLRFGLDDGRTRTLEEVGKEFNVDRERIRQIEAKALRKLRHPSRSKQLRDFL